MIQVTAVQETHSFAQNAVLTEFPDAAASVLQFGEIDIDSSLVSSKEFVPDSGQIMMLNNGCMCCTVKDDLVNMLTDLASTFGPGLNFPCMHLWHMALLRVVSIVYMKRSADLTTTSPFYGMLTDLASTFGHEVLTIAARTWQWLALC